MNPRERICHNRKCRAYGRQGEGHIGIPRLWDVGPRQAAADRGSTAGRKGFHDFWDLNMAGTRDVYEAALESGIEKVLLCSTMGVYGEGARGAGDPPVMTEDPTLEPKDYYGFSKKVCEDIVVYYHRRHGIRTIAYRLGMSVPESFVGYGFRLLKGGADDRDGAQAFLLGLDDASVAFDAFNVLAEVPFSVEEFGRWCREPESFLEAPYPGITGLVEEQGADFGEPVRMWGFTTGR